MENQNRKTKTPQMQTTCNKRGNEKVVLETPAKSPRYLLRGFQNTQKIPTQLAAWLHTGVARSDRGKTSVICFPQENFQGRLSRQVVTLRRCVPVHRGSETVTTLRKSSQVVTPGHQVVTQ